MGQSPIVKGFRDKTVGMTFVGALNKLLKGSKVRRLDWKDEGIYLIIDGSSLMIYLTKDNLLHPLTVSTGDILGKDWVVVEEKRTVH